MLRRVIVPMLGQALCLAVCAAVAACTQSKYTLPVAAKDNRTIALLAPDNENPSKIVLLDTPTQDMRSIAIPNGWRAEKLIWLNDQLLVLGSRWIMPNQFQVVARLLDPATGKFSSAPIRSPYPCPPFAGTWQGKPCVFSAGGTVNTTEIHSLPDFAVVGTLDFPAFALRDGWMVRARLPENLNTTWSSDGWMVSDGKTADGGERFHMATFDAIEVRDSDAKVVMQISRDQIKSVFGTNLTLFAVALSPDHRSFFLAPKLNAIAGNSGWPKSLIYPLGYAVFEVPTGNVRYAQKGTMPAISSAVLTNEGVYVVTDYPEPSTPSYAEKAEHHAWMVLQNETSIQKIVELPIPIAGIFGAGIEIAPSADGKTAVIASVNIKSKLLMIPLAPMVAPSDIRTIKLPD